MMRFPGLGQFGDPAIISQRDLKHGEKRRVAMAVQGMSGLVTDPRVYALNQAHALESWPPSLHALSVPSYSCAMSKAEREACVRWMGELRLFGEFLTDPSAKWDEASDIDFYKEKERKTVAAWRDPQATFSEIRNDEGKRLADDPNIAELVKRLNTILGELSERQIEAPLVKLGSRSPKDSPFWPLCQGRVTCGEEIVLLLLTSTRILEDFMAVEFHEQTRRAIIEQSRNMPIDEFARIVGMTDLQMAESLRSSEEARLNPEPQIWLREYRHFPEWAEFRCFMRRKELVGGTQYNGVLISRDGFRFRIEAYPELVARGPEYERLINEWFPVFRDACPYDDAVFDVVVDVDKHDVLLLETNPATLGTFPGLKDWKTLQAEHAQRKEQGLAGADIAWAVENYDCRQDPQAKNIVLTPENIQQLQALVARRERTLAEHPELRLGRER
jgi:D123